MGHMQGMQANLKPHGPPGTLSVDGTQLYAARVNEPAINKHTVYEMPQAAPQ